MERPDQKKYEQFIAPLVQYDSTWQKYAKQTGYTLELNNYRSPGRLLRGCSDHSNFKMTYIVDFYMEPNWRDIEYSDDLPYQFAVCVFCDRPGKPELRWRLALTIIENTSLDKIGGHLSDYIDQAFVIFKKWPLVYVIEHGELLFRTKAGGWFNPNDKRFKLGTDSIDFED